jgi:hypothetical protein
MGMHIWFSKIHKPESPPDNLPLGTSKTNALDQERLPIEPLWRMTPDAQATFSQHMGLPFECNQINLRE